MAPRSLIAGAILGALALTAPVSAQVVEQVSSDSQSGVPLFTSETLQLTDAALANVSSNQSALFEFGNSSSTLTTRTVGGCKVFPGDFWWPSNFVWSLFDKFLGGALIKTVPLAASCYSSWPQYDANECAAITNDWTDSNLQ